MFREIEVKKVFEFETENTKELKEVGVNLGLRAERLLLVIECDCLNETQLEYLSRTLSVELDEKSTVILTYAEAK